MFQDALNILRCFDVSNTSNTALSDLGSNLSHNTSTWEGKVALSMDISDINICGLRCKARRATWVCTGTSKEVPRINLRDALLTLELMCCIVLKRRSRVKSVFTMVILRSLVLHHEQLWKIEWSCSSRNTNLTPKQVLDQVQRFRLFYYHPRQPFCWINIHLI